MTAAASGSRRRFQLAEDGGGDDNAPFEEHIDAKETRVATDPFNGASCRSRIGAVPA